MNSNICDRKKHSYKNRPYYCPINNMWFYPYMYMNPYTNYMINPYMNGYMTPSYYGNMCSCDDRSQCEATGAYGENNYGFTKEDIYANQYEKEFYGEEENKKRCCKEDSLDDIVTFNEDEQNEHSKKEEKSDDKQGNVSDSELKAAFTEKKPIQLEEVNKSEEEIDKTKQKELSRGIKINMRKVPLKEITD